MTIFVLKACLFLFKQPMAIKLPLTSAPSLFISLYSHLLVWFWAHQWYLRLTNQDSNCWSKFQDCIFGPRKVTALLNYFVSKATITSGLENYPKSSKICMDELAFASLVHIAGGSTPLY